MLKQLLTYLSCAVAAWLLAAVTCVGATEVTNGAFEDGSAGAMPAGWTVGKSFGKSSPGATFGLDDAQRHDGKQSLKITAETGDPSAFVLSTPIDVEPGEQYVLTVHLKGGAAATPARLMVMPQDYKRYASAAVSVRDDWKAYTVAFKAPKDPALPVSLRVDLMEKGTLWIDDVTFAKGSAPAPEGAATLADPSFEDAPADAMPAAWQVFKPFGKSSPGATLAVDGAVGHEGKKSLTIVAQSAEPPAGVSSSPLKVEAGAKYQLTVYLKGSAASTPARLMVVPSDFKGAAATRVEVTDQWTPFKLAFTSKGDGLPVSLRVELLDKGQLWIDDVAFTRIAAAKPKAEAPAAADALPDGGFESATAGTMPAGWQIGKAFGKASPGATFGVDGSVAHEGGKSIKITAATGDPAAILQSAPLKVEADAQYVFSVWIKGEAAATAGRVLIVPGDFKGIASTPITVTDQWKQCTLNFIAKKGEPLPVHLRVDLLEKGTLWVDDVKFVKAAGPLPVSSGTTGDAQVLGGDFEQTMAGAMPGGWQISKAYGQAAPGATFGVDASVARAGKQSMRIASPTDSGILAILLSNPVAVEPNQAYVLSAYLKGEAKYTDLEFGVFRVDMKAAERMPIVVTDQWRQYRFVLRTTDKSAPAYFARFDLGQQGTVWIDDVQLTRLADAAADAGTAIGYRYSDTRGSKDVTLTVGAATGKDVPYINGICYHRGFGAPALDPRFKEIRPKTVRYHNVTSHQKILTKNADGTLSYDFTLFDKTIGEILAVGAIPHVNLCFTPLALVDKPDPAKIRSETYYLGPPSDLKQWEQYIHTIVQHCVQKYPGSDQWYWIVGNEPGVAQFSMGTKDDFYAIYKASVAGATRAMPNIQIGAGAFAHRSWLKAFVDKCGADNTRLDLLSWHHYSLVPEDYTGKIEQVRKLVGQYPSLSRTKLIVDEWATLLPDGKPPVYSAGHYAAAHAAPSIYYMAKAGLSYQTYFIAHSLHGWGMIGKEGQKHPIFNLFKLYSLMGTAERAMTVPDGEPYVGGFATQQPDGTITVLVWHAKNLHDTSPNADKSVTVRLDGVPATATVTRYAIDAEHSNGMADPKRQELETAPTTAKAGSGGLDVSFAAPVNSVSLLVIK